MARLLVHVEGETEEEFVDELLAAYLLGRGFSLVTARLLGNPCPRAGRGGIRGWEASLRDIVRHLKEDRRVFTALMVDFYGMPGDWPGRLEVARLHGDAEKASFIEARIVDAVQRELGGRFDSRRLVPLVMMHEFEALLFSDPEKLAASLYRPELAEQFVSIRNGFASPEEINDSLESAPSKRILKLYPRYEKPLGGALAAIEIGLETMRSECQHFNDWLSRLERIPAELAADR